MDVQQLCVRHRAGASLALSGVSFRVRGGERIGVVGASGAGKRSLFDALLRLVEPVRGRVLIDGLDCAALAPSELRSRIGVLERRPVIFPGTVRENVDCFRAFSDARVLLALQQAHLLPDGLRPFSKASWGIFESPGARRRANKAAGGSPALFKVWFQRKTPRGGSEASAKGGASEERPSLAPGPGQNAERNGPGGRPSPGGETPAGETPGSKEGGSHGAAGEERALSLYTTLEAGGEALSMGRRQLICVARLLLNRCKVLLLDEPTACADAATSELIEDALRRNFEAATVLRIASRTDDVMGCDRVLVLDEGRVVELDAPRTLLARPDGAFARMARAERGEKNAEGKAG
jgi:ABC-type multidrug transport system ATPase subunit